MVYWGCGTPRNRCMWGMFAFSALAGSLLLIAGAARLDVCSKLPVYVHITGTCKVGPVAMTIIGCFALLGTIPSLLFFSGCAKGPPQTKYSEGVPASGITVVRRTADGPQVFQYDANGKLLVAPDCHRHCKGSSKDPQQYTLKPIKTVPTLPKEVKECSSNGSSPRAPGRLRLYSSESGDTATAEVYVSAVPMGPLAAARALAQRQLQQQQEQQQQLHEQQQQQMGQEMQEMQEQQHEVDEPEQPYQQQGQQQDTQGAYDYHQQHYLNQEQQEQQQLPAGDYYLQPRPQY